MHFKEEIKHNILKNILTSKKRPKAIEGTFYVKTKPCYILGGNNFQLKEG
jgi:hypothetical protein